MTLTIDKYSHEWVSLRAYLQRRRNDLVEQLLDMNDITSISRLQGRIVEIDELVTTVDEAEPSTVDRRYPEWPARTG